MSAKPIQYKIQSHSKKGICNQLLEIFHEAPEKLIKSQTSRFSDLKKSLNSSLKEYKNMTSIRFQFLDIKLLLRDLLLSSDIQVDENQVLNSVQSHLNEVSSNRKTRCIQSALRGYLGMLNELFHIRHVYESKMDQYLEIRKFKTIEECVFKSPLNNVQLMLEDANIEISERSGVLREIFLGEWTAIGKMKKNLEKLIENCRICEKKVKIFDLVKHSDICEGTFELKEKMNSLEVNFLDLEKQFNKFFEEKKDKFLSSPKYNIFFII